MNNRTNLINAMRQEDSLTANGAITHSTSLNSCLDLFFLAGATRNMSVSDIVTAFQRAMNEELYLAFKILFWARDCRGGAGEKRFFHIISSHLQLNHREIWDAVAYLVPEYGSWKDLLIVSSPNEDMLGYMRDTMGLGNQEPLHDNNPGLLAKWFPRKGEWFNAMCKYLGCTPKQLRKRIVKLTNVVETKMCNRDWSSIDFKTVPSLAMNNYRNAFHKRDGERFRSFISDVLEGKTTVNASVLFPHQLVQAIMKGEDAAAVEAQWKSLPNYMESNTDRILPVCDVSGSMTGLPMEVSIALGLYISERNTGIFKDAFVTFSGTPELCYVPGKTLSDRVYALESSSWGFNTDLSKTFQVILDKAMANNLPASEMPNKILIISDMEFDEATCGTNYDTIKELYRLGGYELPSIIFWNVNGRLGNVPVAADEQDVGLVSGFSPAILKSILNSKIPTPVDLMLETLDVKRYDDIVHSLLRFGSNSVSLASNEKDSE